jgi:hypothetical protein
MAGTGSPGRLPDCYRVFSHKYEGIYAYLKQHKGSKACPRNQSDVAIVESELETGVQTYIVMPLPIYGIGAGLFNRPSMQIPAVARGAVQVKCAEVLGDGTGTWGNVHINDLTAFYEALIRKALIAL